MASDTSSFNPRFFRFHVSLLVLLFVFVISGLTLVNDLNIYTPDSTRYLVWAKSLASFDGFTDATLPDPIRYVVHAPLYPMLLVPAALVTSSPIIPAKMFTLLCGAGGLSLFYFWLLKRMGRGFAIAGCALLACNPMYLVFSTEVLSDIPFAVCCIALFALMEERSRVEPIPARTLAGIGAILAAGVLLREIGISLVIGMSAFLLLRRRWKECLAVLALPLSLYALWYVRNEILVAGFELPVLTNAKLMTSHFFTLPDAGLPSEWLARIMANAGVYGKNAGRLLLFPFHGWIQFDVVYLNRSPLLELSAILEAAKYPLMACTLGAAGYGAYRDMNVSGIASLRLAVLVAYCGVVLLYPVNDIRFMVPVMIVMAYYVMMGIASIAPASRGIVLNTAMIFAFAVLLMPNLLWDMQYRENSRSYNASPVSFYESTRGLKKYPSHFTKPFRLAGEWIRGNTPPDAVILTQWKDLTSWSGGRSVYPADQTVSLTDFEALIRDYGLTHLVTVVQKSGAREFDMQMRATRNYAFSRLERIANIEIYLITPRTPPSRQADSSTAFRHAVSCLVDGSYGRASEILDTARSADSTNIALAFTSAIAREFSMHLDEARDAFIAIAGMPQSLMYAEEANLHRQMIDLLSRAAASSSPQERGNEYVTASGICWNLGYRVRARELARTSLRADSTSLPAALLGAHFAIAEGDTLEAVRCLELLRRTQPQHPATGLLTTILLTVDSLKIAAGPSEKSRQYAAIGAAYQGLRISDGAINNYLLALREDSTNIQALSALAGMYESKRKWWPAGRLLARGVRLTPEDAAMAERLRLVASHL